MTRLGRVARAQGLFYIVTGGWPVVSLRSFEWVTGDKTDDWLVRSNGAVIAAVGAGQLRAAGRDEGGAALLGVLTAASLLAVDVVYVARGRIPKRYLIDAAIEAAWLLGLWRSRRSGKAAATRLALTRHGYPEGQP